MTSPNHSLQNQASTLITNQLNHKIETPGHTLLGYHATSTNEGVAQNLRLCCTTRDVPRPLGNRVSIYLQPYLNQKLVGTEKEEANNF